MTIIDQFQPVPIVGIAAGAPGSGKSTLAQIFIEREGFTKVSFAEPLKLMVGSMLLDYGFTEEETQTFLYRDKESEIPGLGVTSRFLQRTLGTEWGRDIVRQTIWIDIWLWRVWRAIENGARGIVVDDMRFVNELALIRSIGGVTVFVDRPFEVEPSTVSWWARLLQWAGFPPRTKTHRSEGAIGTMDVDVVVKNHWSLEIFQRIILTIPAHVFSEIDAETIQRYSQFREYMIAAQRQRRDSLASLAEQNPEAWADALD